MEIILGLVAGVFALVTGGIFIVVIGIVLLVGFFTIIWGIVKGVLK